MLFSWTEVNPCPDKIKTMFRIKYFVQLQLNKHFFWTKCLFRTWTLPKFVAYFYFGEDLPWTIPKSGCVLFLCFDWEFGGQNSREFEACLSFCDSLPNQWPISIEYHLPKGTCPFYFGVVYTVSAQIDEKTTQVCGELVNEKRKIQDEPRRQMEIEHAYLSRGLQKSVGHDDCWRPPGSSQKLIVFFVVLFVRSSLVKPSRKKGCSGEWMEDARVVQSSSSTVQQKTPFRNLTIAEK